MATHAGENHGTGVADSSLGRAAYRTGRILGRALAFVERIPPWLVLGALVLLTWFVAAEAARIALHNGRLYYNGGDGSWYYSSAWALGHGMMPLSGISYGYPLLLAPIAAIAGSSILAAMPAIIAFNLLVLAPIGLACVYGIVRMLAGRAYAYLACLLWVLFPVLVIHYFLADYHARYVDITLPSEVGLSILGDYPSMILLLVAAYFTLRLASSGRYADALAAGFAVGIALVIKPANALFIPAPVLALLVARRFAGLGIGAAAVVPSLVGLMFWKQRGEGLMPLFQTAAGSDVTLAAVALTLVASGHLAVRYYLQLHVHVNWHEIHHNLDSFREYTWSQRMIYFTVGGGLVGLARRSGVTAVLAGTWGLVYFVVKGSGFDIPNGSFFTHMIAAFPAYFLLVVSVPFLLPFVGRRRPTAPASTSTSTGRLPLVAAGVLGTIAVGGMLFVAVVPTSTASRLAIIPNPNLLVPLSQFDLAAAPGAKGVALSWPAQKTHGADVAYVITRARGTSAAACVRPPGASNTCAYPATIVGTTNGSTSYLDHPPPGMWAYRVGLTASPYPPKSPTDLVVLSRPAQVVVHRGTATH